MALVDLLQDIADGLQIVRGGNTGIELAEPIAFGLTPPLPSSLDTLQLGDVNALAFTKDVRFTDALSPTGPLATYLTSATNIAGGQPVVDPTMTANLPLPVALGNTLTLPTLSGPSSPSAGNLLSGTPGLIGQISGTLPIPIQVP